jgi:membrane protein implicated in regulation of membrane protease activity
LTLSVSVSVYLGCLLFAGVLLAASAVFDHDHAHDGGAGHAHDGLGLPLLSLRFWTFALGAFGLTGALLTWAGLAPVVTTVAAGAVGLGVGWGAARALGRLARRPLGLLPAAEAHVGREGTLLLAVAPGQRGKLRLQAGGTVSDFLAETDGASLPAGTAVLVVGVRGNALLVERSPALPPSSSPTP